MNLGDYVFVWPFLLAQSPINYAHPEASIFLPCKKNGAPKRRGSGPNPALAEVLIILFSNLSKFHR